MLGGCPTRWLVCTDWLCDQVGGRLVPHWRYHGRAARSSLQGGRCVLVPDGEAQRPRSPGAHHHHHQHCCCHCRVMVARMAVHPTRRTRPVQRVPAADGSLSILLTSHSRPQTPHHCGLNHPSPSPRCYHYQYTINSTPTSPRYTAMVRPHSTTIVTR